MLRPGWLAAAGPAAADWLRRQLGQLGQPEPRVQRVQHWTAGQRRPGAAPEPAAAKAVAVLGGELPAGSGNKERRDRPKGGEDKGDNSVTKAAAEKLGGSSMKALKIYK